LGTRKAAPRNQLESWLKNLGFRYDPFQYLEASSDPHLGEYIVGHEIFAVAWDEAPAVIYAPAGGGKTTMRIYTTRACWIGLGGFHPFPIPYLFQAYSTDGQAPSWDEHARRLVQASATSLLISLSFRPEIFLALDSASRRELGRILTDSLPGSLSHYLSILRDSGKPFTLSRLLNRAYVLPNPPDHERLLDFCDAIEDSISDELTTSSSPDNDFERIAQLLLGPLGFRSIFVLVDGVDAFPETVSAPGVVVDWMASLLEKVPEWLKHRIFLKSFIPSEVQPLLTDRLAGNLPVIRHARLEWTSSLLAEMIHRRVFAATGGEFGSLDAVSSPALRDVETQLAQSVIPLPREVLLLVRRVLAEYVHRTGGSSGFIEPEDITRAKEWYQAYQVWPVSAPASATA
jgi:hypothetical protein